MADLEKPVANPQVVLREEFDEWGVLFDPDSGEAYGVDPVSIFIWKLLDGEHTAQDILEKLRQECENGIPGEAPDHLKEFIADLESKGLAGYTERS